MKTKQLISEILKNINNNLDVPYFLIQDIDSFLCDLNYYKAKNFLKNIDQFVFHLKNMVKQYDDEYKKIMSNYLEDKDTNWNTKKILTLINNVRSILILTITEFWQANKYRVIFNKKIKKHQK